MRWLMRQKGNMELVPRLGKRPPANFLEQHALQMLTLEPDWTVSMYAALNDLTEEDTAELREFLKSHLPRRQWMPQQR